MTTGNPWWMHACSQHCFQIVFSSSSIDQNQKPEFSFLFFLCLCPITNQIASCRLAWAGVLCYCFGRMDGWVDGKGGRIANTILVDAMLAFFVCLSLCVWIRAWMNRSTQIGMKWNDLERVCVIVPLYLWILTSVLLLTVERTWSPVDGHSQQRSSFFV